MDDRFMNELREQPSPAYARALRERLRLRERPNEEAAAPALRWLPLVAPALGMAALLGVILFPSVRVSAQAFLDLFRVRNFTAVSVDPDRVRQLEDGKLDLKALIGDRIQTVKDPGPPQVVASAALAGAAAGIVVKVPSFLPGGLQADTVTVRGAGEARLTADATRLRHLLEALDIRDVVVPAALDGQVIELRAPAVVEQRFRADRRRATLLQSRSPEVSLPSGVNLADLGEIGLRILGLAPAEARRLSQTIDWRSTMLIPVPGDAGSFRRVDVRGNPALIVTSVGSSEGGHRGGGTMVLWSQGEMVYALTGNLEDADLLQMANSVQ